MLMIHLILYYDLSSNQFVLNREDILVSVKDLTLHFLTHFSLSLFLLII